MGTFNRQWTKNLTIAPQLIYTATSNTQVTSARFSNTSTQNEVYVTWYVTDSTDTQLGKLCYNLPIPVESVWEGIANSINLLNGDKLFAFISENNAMDVIVSVIEELP